MIICGCSDEQYCMINGDNYKYYILQSNKDGSTII